MYTPTALLTSVRIFVICLENKVCKKYIKILIAGHSENYSKDR